LKNLAAWRTRINIIINDQQIAVVIVIRWWCSFFEYTKRISAYRFTDTLGALTHGGLYGRVGAINEG
jgi:uncharacterized protein (DUF486 family)